MPIYTQDGSIVVRDSGIAINAGCCCEFCTGCSLTEDSSLESITIENYFEETRRNSDGELSTRTEQIPGRTIRRLGTARSEECTIFVPVRFQRFLFNPIDTETTAAFFLSVDGMVRRQEVTAVPCSGGSVSEVVEGINFSDEVRFTVINSASGNPLP